jgi:hypothetical protein
MLFLAAHVLLPPLAGQHCLPLVGQHCLPLVGQHCLQW